MIQQPLRDSGEWLTLGGAMKIRAIAALCAGAFAFGPGASPASAALFASADHSYPVFLTTNTFNANFARNIVEGSNVLIQLSNVFANDVFWAPFYNSQPGFSAVELSTAAPITSAALAGFDLFIGAGPDDPYTASEAAALSAFLAGGGNVLLAGDNSNFVPQNSFINALLAQLGSSMSIVSGQNGGNDAPRLTVNAYTFNAPVLEYEASSTLVGGIPLYGLEGSGIPILAFEPTRIKVVPEPATWAMMIAGFFMVGSAMRRKVRRALRAA